MTDLESRLKGMLSEVDHLLGQAQGMPYEVYLRSHLVPVQCELERQLGNELARQNALREAD